MHRKVVKNQKNAFNELKSNLKKDSCILILDYKENFKLSLGGNEVGQDYYNKRQISCLGGVLIFNNNSALESHFLNFSSNILNNDSLFSSNVLENIVDEIKYNFKFKRII